MYKILVSRIAYFLFKSKTLPLLVSSFVGFSFGLLVAAIYFPIEMESRLVKSPQVVSTTEIKPDDSYIKNITDVTYKRIKFQDLNGWKLDQLSEVLPLMKKSCLKLATIQYENKFGLSVTNWRDGCKKIIDIKSKDDNNLIKMF